MFDWNITNHKPIDGVIFSHMYCIRHRKNRFQRPILAIVFGSRLPVFVAVGDSSRAHICGHDLPEQWIGADNCLYHQKEWKYFF